MTSLQRRLWSQRSLSTNRRVKTNKRSTMLTDWLSSLALLHAPKEMLIDCERVLWDFRKKNQKNLHLVTVSRQLTLTLRFSSQSLLWHSFSENGSSVVFHFCLMLYKKCALSTGSTINFASYYSRAPLAKKLISGKLVFWIILSKL